MMKKEEVGAKSVVIPVTDEEVDEWQRLRDEGMTVSEVSERFGRSPATIVTHTFPAFIGLPPRRHWATWEDVVIKRMRAEGDGPSAIGQAIDRTANSVANRTPDVLKEPQDELDQYILDNCRYSAPVIAIMAGETCEEIERRSKRMGIMYPNREEDPLAKRCNLDEADRLLVLESQEDYAKACDGDEFCRCELCDIRTKIDIVWDSGERGTEYLEWVRTYLRGGKEHERLLERKGD